jgi:hypothetical protein
MATSASASSFDELELRVLQLCQRGVVQLDHFEAQAPERSGNIAAVIGRVGQRGHVLVVADAND